MFSTLNYSYQGGGEGLLNNKVCRFLFPDETSCCDGDNHTSNILSNNELRINNKTVHIQHKYFEGGTLRDPFLTITLVFEYMIVMIYGT